MDGFVGAVGGFVWVPVLTFPTIGQIYCLLLLVVLCCFDYSSCNVLFAGGRGMQVDAVLFFSLREIALSRF